MFFCNIKEKKVTNNNNPWWKTMPAIIVGIATTLGGLSAIYAEINNWEIFEKFFPATTIHSTPFFMKNFLTKEDLDGKSKWELVIMRNEVFARHGRRFKRLDIQEYFNNQSWYKPIYLPENFPSYLLSEIQINNVKFIIKREKEIIYL